MCCFGPHNFSFGVSQQIGALKSGSPFCERSAKMFRANSFIVSEPKFLCLHSLFTVMFPAVIESGSDAKLCASLLKPQESLTMTISLLDERDRATQLVQQKSSKPFHRCFSFQVCYHKTCGLSIGLLYTKWTFLYRLLE